MEQFLKNKVALITGGGQGVGFGVAQSLSAAGAHVVLTGRGKERLDKACEIIEQTGGRAHGVVADVCDASGLDVSVAETLSTFGGLNILVNNAQIVPMGPLLKLDEDVLQKGWTSGPLASFRLMRQCYPHLKGDGVIINVISSVIKRWDMSNYGGYAAVKAATQQLTRAAACEWGADGIRVNAIMPHAKSPALAGWIDRFPEEADAFRKSIPLQRIGECREDIGDFVAQICGPNAGYLSGQTIGLDGGQAMIG